MKKLIFSLALMMLAATSFAMTNIINATDAAPNHSRDFLLNAKPNFYPALSIATNTTEKNYYWTIKVNKESASVEIKHDEIEHGELKKGKITFDYISNGAAGCVITKPGQGFYVYPIGNNIARGIISYSITNPGHCGSY